MIAIKIYRIIINQFSNRGIGERHPFLRNLYYRQLSKLMVYFLSPITISGGYKLHLPKNGIDYLLGPYEEFATELMRKILKPGDTFLDIGAGIGYHTIISSKIIGENGNVISFEPDPDYFKLLQKNIKQNKCFNVLSYQKAVSDRAGKINFYRYDKVGRNRLEEVNSFLANFEVRSRIEIESVKLDDLSLKG